jgi:uncharacterized UPF0160 family protein
VKPFSYFVTHGGCFHADDVVATAIARLHHELLSDGRGPLLVRTRDEHALAFFLGDSASLVYDVGFQYAPGLNNYDHHQGTFSETRDNGVPFAACGLVWRALGPAICDSLARRHGCSSSAQLHAQADASLIQFVDAIDNGVAEVTARLTEPSHATLHCVHFCEVINAFIPEEVGDASVLDAAFERASQLASQYLRHMLLSLARQQVIQQDINLQSAEAIIFLSTGASFSSADFSQAKALFVIQPSESDKTWQVQQVPAAPGAFVGRLGLRPEWRGLAGASLVAASGVADAVFCHRSGYMAKSLTKEAAIELALKSLPSRE